MKTTVELPDGLLEEAKKVARREGTSLRDLLEAGLRAVLKEHRQPHPSFELRDASFHGRGLQRPFREDRWDEIREASYEGRGG
jgi:hypothetical protein